MHIGIQVTPQNFILLSAIENNAVQVLSTLTYPSDDPDQAAKLLATALPPQTSSIMMNLPAAWSWSFRALMQKTLQAIVPEVILAPTPIVLLHALPDKNFQDIFWWEPWREALAFGFISRLSDQSLTLEGYGTGNKEDCIRSASIGGYSQHGIWALDLGMRPAGEQAAFNLLPVKLKTWIYEENILRDGLTRCASVTKSYLSNLKITGLLPFHLTISNQLPAYSEPIVPVADSLEYPYQGFSLYADVSSFVFSLPDTQPVHLSEADSQIPLWSGSASELKEACLWIHPAIGLIASIKNTLHFLPHQVNRHLESILESRLNVPLPADPQDITASLQLMLHHLAAKTVD